MSVRNADGSLAFDDLTGVEMLLERLPLTKNGTMLGLIASKVKARWSVSIKQKIVPETRKTNTMNR